jgi:hypothetical protein
MDDKMGEGKFGFPRQEIAIVFRTTPRTYKLKPYEADALKNKSLILEYPLEIMHLLHRAFMAQAIRHEGLLSL